MMKRISSRSAFTLVELLIVIAIIMVITAMGLPIIMLTMQTLEESKVSREIKLLDQACEQFKATFGRYPPGRIMLCEDMRGYQKAISQHLLHDCLQTDPKHIEALNYLASMSMEYLQSIFPGIDLNAGHDWNGDGVIDDRQYVLNGSEAMLFFLGGMRYGKGAIDEAGSNRSGPFGFNTDKTRPTVKTTSTRLGPFFEFDESRILYEITVGLPPGSPGCSPAGSPMSHNWTVGVSSGFVRFPGEEFIGFFARYTDVWKTPYAYLYARSNHLDNYAYSYSTYCYKLGMTIGTTFNYHMWFSDFLWVPTPKLPGYWHPIPMVYIEFVPYIDNVQAGRVKFYNSNRFQIISAGRDREFGSGGFLNITHGQEELSSFRNYQGLDVAPDARIQNYDNFSNITFKRVVPRP